MKRLFLMLTLIIVGCSSPCTDYQEKIEFAYRYDPFIFPLPEYRLKANVIQLKSEKMTAQDSTEIEFFDLKANIPGQWTCKQEHLSKTKPVYIIKNKDNPEKHLMISVETKFSFSESCKEPTNEKDFCSAFKTPVELYEKFYTLTPDMDGLTTGDLWIIHRKGLIFRFMDNIYIYKNINFKAFRRDWSSDKPKTSKIKTDITIFPLKQKNDYVFLTITMSFIDEAFIKDLLKSLSIT